MIQLYLFSIIIWAIMIYGTAYLFQDKIRTNGWLNTKKDNRNPWITMFFMVAIPLIRVLFFVTVIIMVGTTKEKFDKWLEEIKDEFN